MKRYERIFERIALGADLPGMTIPGQSLVEIAGESRVLIENHKGVTVYECNAVHVRVSFGELCVCGSELEVVRMSRCQLVITGHIDCVTLRRRVG